MLSLDLSVYSEHIKQNNNSLLSKSPFILLYWLMGYKNIICVFRLVLIYTVCWARKSSQISYYKLQIIHVNYRIIYIRQILLIPYPTLHPDTICFRLSISAWI
jgi:hypothetical protein